MKRNCQRCQEGSGCRRRPREVSACGEEAGRGRRGRSDACVEYSVEASVDFGIFGGWGAKQSWTTTNAVVMLAGGFLLERRT